MKIVGLIAEYNPFHNGHEYHIQKAKEVTGADTVIVVMSGNFVQRGAPAIMPKHLRAKVALKSGASLVLELPVCFATGSAEYFAQGAVALLAAVGGAGGPGLAGGVGGEVVVVHIPLRGLQGNVVHDLRVRRPDSVTAVSTCV